MHGKLAIIVLTGATLALSGSLYAAGRGGHDPTPGGQSGSHIGVQGGVNTNAQFGTDAQRGLDRASQRMDEEGTEHEQAGEHGADDAHGESGDAHPSHGKSHR